MKTTRAFGWMVAIAVAVLSLAASSAHAQYTIDTLSAWGGAVNGFQRVGNIGYCAAGQRLVILDMANETNIHELGSVVLNGVASAIAVRGQYAYVGGMFSNGTDVSGRLVAVDVSNPAAPSIVWREANAGSPLIAAPTRAQVYGSLLYVTDGVAFGELMAYDLSNPANPVRQSTNGCCSYRISIGAAPYDFAIAGDLMYAICKQSGKVLICTLQPDALHPGADPLHPVALSNIATSSSGNPLVGSRIAVDGATVIVQENDQSQPDGNQYIVKLVDVSNPASPVLRSAYTDVLFAKGVAIHGHVAFVADYFGGDLAPNNPNLNRLKGLAVLDVTDPANPSLIGTYNTSHSSIRDVQVVGNRAYLLCDGQGLEVLDISDPTNPTRVGGYFSPAELRDITPVGNLLYIADQWNGFSIVDVSNPVSPHPLGVFRTPGDITHQQSMHVDVAGNLAYLAAGYGGINVVDVSDPTAPTLVLQYSGTLGIPFMKCWYVEVYGNVLHCSIDWAEPHLVGTCPVVSYNNYDLASMTTSPVVIGQACSSAYRFVTKDGMSYGGQAGANAAARIDNRDPDNPIDLGDPQFNGGSEMTIVGNFLYEPSRSPSNPPFQGGFYIYNIADPDQLPAQVGFVPTSTWNGETTNTVGVAGNRAIVGTDGHLVALDVSDPTTPHVLATSVSGATHVVAAGNLAYSTNVGSNTMYVGGSNQTCGGLFIRRIRCKADYDGNGTIAVADIFAFLNGWFAGDPQADFDGANGIQVADIFAFLNAWFAGCP